MSDGAKTVVACRGVRKVFHQGAVEVPVLLGVDLEVAAGERVAIVGASGSGKSTLLHILGGLDDATAGEVSVQGEELSRQDETARGQTRNRALGFVYQFHHLLAEFTALENVAMPLLIRRMEKGEAYAQAGEMLKQVGLVESTSAAARLIEQGGVRIDGEKVDSSRAVVTPGPARLFQVGKRGFLRIEVVQKKS